MKDKDIIKALECMKGASENDFSTITVKSAINLINRQQAEIERFKKIEITVNEFWCVLQKFTREKLKEKPTLEELLEYIEHARAEAIKEFADRLKNNICNDFGFIVPGACDRDIDNLVKEMVGDDNAK